jgi:hypothetical protein
VKVGIGTTRICGVVCHPVATGWYRTFSNPGSTLQQCNTRQLTQFALLCSSFTTSGFTQPRKSRALFDPLHPAP